MLGQCTGQKFRRMLARFKILVSYLGHWIFLADNVLVQCARITLTPFTASYFFLAVLTCLALTTMRVITFVDNSAAMSILSPIQGIPDFGIPIYEQGKLKLCVNMPSQGACADVIDFGTKKRVDNNQTFVRSTPQRSCSTLTS